MRASRDRGPRERPPLSVREARRTYALLQRALPRAYRVGFGDESLELFTELAELAHARRGAAGVLVVWVRSAVDLVRRSPREIRQPISPIPGRTSSMGSILTDARYALRTVVRRPGFSLVVVATLAAAIAADTAVFSVVDAVLLRSLPYRDAERLTLVFNRYPTLGVTRGAQNPRDYFDYIEMTDAFSQIEAVGGTNPNTLTGFGDSRRVPVSGATVSLFPMLGAELAVGRHFTDADEWNTAIVSHGFWQQYLGEDPEAMGRSITLNDTEWTVVGVLPRGFRLHLPPSLGIPADIAVWGPIKRFLGPPGDRDMTAHWMTTVARLSPGATLEQAQSQLDAVAEFQRTDQPRRGEREAEIEVVALHDEIVGPVRGTLMTLLGAVGFLLLIACANVANLMLVRAQGRRAELAVRVACGASRGRIARLLITEGVILAGLAAIVGTVVARLGVAAILAMRPEDLPLTERVGVDLRVLGFAIVASACAALLFGLAPAATVSRGRLSSPLAERSTASGAFVRPRARSLLVVAEVALSLVLLTGGGLLLRSFMALAAQSPGLETRNVLTFVAPPPPDVYDGERDRANRWDVNPSSQRYYRELHESFAAVPGVESVANVWPIPLSGDVSGATFAPADRADEQQGNRAAVRLVTPGYFATVGLPIVAGRAFTWDDSGDEVVIDETLAARYWPDRDPVGETMLVGWWSGTDNAEIVGVAAPVRSIDVSSADPPTIYRLGAAYGYSAQPFVVRTTGDPTSSVGNLREVLRQAWPGVPLDEVETLDGYLDRQLVGLRFAMNLIGAFAVCGLLIATVGLYGVVSYVAGQRVREIGIRMAVGADRGRIFRMVLLQGVGVALMGVIAGLIGSRWLTASLESLLYGVTATDIVTFAVVALGLGAIATLACWLPAARASRSDPMTSLRAD